MLFFEVQTGIKLRFLTLIKLAYWAVIAHNTRPDFAFSTLCWDFLRGILHERKSEKLRKDGLFGGRGVQGADFLILAPLLWSQADNIVTTRTKIMFAY